MPANVETMAYIKLSGAIGGRLTMPLLALKIIAKLAMKPRRKRLERVWFGRGADLKVNALNEALRLAA